MLLFLILSCAVFCSNATSSSTPSLAVQREAQKVFGCYFGSTERMERMRERMRRHRQYMTRNGRWRRMKGWRKWKGDGHMRQTAKSPMEINNTLSDYLYQGDILLTYDQAEAIFSDVESNIDNSTRTKRQAYNLLSSKWPAGTPIYYHFFNISSPVASKIRQALFFWQSETCMTFVENGTAKGRIRFIAASGCWSLVGKSRQSPSQDISIGTGCDSYRTITHEIGHALGMFHHQARYDRDDYVSVVADNVKPDYLSQYDKQSEATLNTYGVGYDVGSVMHYKQREFTRSKDLVTLTTNDPDYQNSMASNRWPSFADVKIVNSHLCSGVCKSSLSCENSGYIDPKNCRQCKCPSAFSGTTCNSRNSGRGLKKSCGGDFVTVATWTEVVGEIGSTTATVNATECFWIIRAPPGRFVESFMTRTPNTTCTESCETQGIQVTVASQETAGVTYCCGNGIPRQLTSNGQLITVRVYTFEGVAGFRWWHRLAPVIE